MSTKKTSKSSSKKATKKTKSRKTTTSTKKSRPAQSESDRIEHRVPINLLVDYRAHGSYLFDFCKNLGTGGVFIETSSPLPKGSNIELTFTIPDSKETVNAKGEVIWVQDKVAGRKDLTPGMGVQFSSFSNDKRQLLEDFIGRYNKSTGSSSIENNSGKRSA